MADQTGRESDKFMLRLPDGMRGRIKAAADMNGRSMNAEIVNLLEQEFPAPKEDAIDRAAREVVELLTAKVPREVWTDDFESRIRQLIEKHATNLPEKGD